MGGVLDVPGVTKSQADLAYARRDAILPGRLNQVIDPQAVMTTPPTITHQAGSSLLTGTTLYHAGLKSVTIVPTSGSTGVTVHSSSRTKFDQSDVGSVLGLSNTTNIPAGVSITAVAADGLSATLSTAATGTVAGGVAVALSTMLSKEFRYVGFATLGAAATSYPANSAVACLSPTGTPLADEYEIHGEHYGQVIQLLSIVKTDGTSRFRLWVNDGSGWKAHTATFDSFLGTASICFSKIDFGSVAARQIRIEVANQVSFIGLTTVGTDSWNRGVSAAHGRLVVAADSYVEGLFGGNQARFLGPHKTFGRLIGMGEIYNRGQASTGWLNEGQAVRTSNARLRTRLPEIAALAPDVLAIFLGVNDTSFSQAQITAEANLCFDYIAANMPRTYVFVVGPYNAASLPLTNLQAIDAGLRAACLAHRIPYASPQNADVIAGDGTVLVRGNNPIIEGGYTATGFNGGAFMHTDNLHATQIGYNYIGRWAAGAFNRVRGYETTGR